MKILNRYILKSFLIPFLATFFVILFVLIMQALWLEFDKIAGKGIGFVIIFKFLGYIALMMVPTALPIAILLSSIMALGNMAENYEFAAVKSAGISLQRFITPLITLMVIMSFLNFLFLNYVFPYASLKSKNLVYNMKMKEPGLALVPGTFNDEIPGYSIKFEEKYGEEENLLKTVKIYKIELNNKKNKTITADRGEIVSEEGSRYLTLLLYDGYYFEDVMGTRNSKKDREHVPFAKAHFDEYKFNIDVSEIGNFNPDDLKYKNGRQMLSLKQLDYYLDSLQTPYREYIDNSATRINKILRINKLLKDTIVNAGLDSVLLDNFDEKGKDYVTESAMTLVKGNIENISNSKNAILNKQKIINSYNTEYHRRIAFALACVVLFFVGAPLGSIIRKGGFGLPMILAIVIFVIYFFISELGKNMAGSGEILPAAGGWLATIILLPFGALLMIRATKDKGIFNLDMFMQPIVNFFQKIFYKLNKKESFQDGNKK